MALRVIETEVGDTELDDSLLDTHRRKQRAEYEANEASETKNNKLDLAKSGKSQKKCGIYRTSSA